ncbi:unnamed protein product [Soboliphyme baturini]|uniref:snRNA-activating protein complex subunit 3 n=1 Tax=Soboliphyme baturini TaxID=241478 RepID=A0A183J180_9BILA|nr:unnamed protein product [Soboliphyme baturini]
MFILNSTDEVGPFKKAKMQETKFIDLTLRLGQFYVYKHQGDCEHLMLFSDLRALHADSPQNIAEYPISLSRKSRKRTVCVACQNLTAGWIVQDGDRMPGPIVHMCDRCFREFNYDKDGKKIGNFRAVPYADRTTFL